MCRVIYIPLTRRQTTKNIEQYSTGFTRGDSIGTKNVSYDSPITVSLSSC